MTLSILFKKTKSIKFCLIEDIYGLLLLKNQIKASFTS